MIRSMPRPAATVLLALVLLAGATAGARAEALPDSSQVDQWTLANGLRVTVRQLPGASIATVAVAFGVGSASDPAGREGLSWLLAEQWFTAAAGDVPERTRGELLSLRPEGWRVSVQPRATLFVEAAGTRQFPGMLHQTAQRMRGVRLTPATAQAALANTRRDLRGLFAGDPDSMVWAIPSAMAGGADSAALVRYATGAGLESPVRDAERLLRARFTPANATLALVGDFKGIDLRAFVEREFGGIPAGTPAAAVTARPRPAAAMVVKPGLRDRAGVTAVIAPALTDADHPEFLLCTLIMGARARAAWGDPMPPLASRFKYSLFDDPDLVRFYPPTDPVEGDTTWLAGRLEEVLDPMARTEIGQNVVESYKWSVFWLLGGPMLPDMARRAPIDPAVQSSLATSMAMRALWAPEPFWQQYRQRFGSIQQLPLDAWVGHALDPRRQVRLVLWDPARR